MAKRRAEDTLLHDSPSKRCCRVLCSVDMQLESTPPTGGVSLSPPSLLAADGDTSTEDCTFNSFQYWRVPLPELDLSLLEDVNRHSQIKPKSKMKDCSSDAMET
uniref:Putative WW-binding domain-containing protein n=1 Tax=Seriola lalandi dorsalis TaxID=1841481 RepID=A0A3B4XSL2_SERLL